MHRPGGGAEHVRKGLGARMQVEVAVVVAGDADFIAVIRIAAAVDRGKISVVQRRSERGQQQVIQRRLMHLAFGVGVGIRKGALLCQHTDVAVMRDFVRTFKDWAQAVSQRQQAKQHHDQP